MLYRWSNIKHNMRKIPHLLFTSFHKYLVRDDNIRELSYLICYMYAYAHVSLYIQTMSKDLCLLYICQYCQKSDLYSYIFLCIFLLPQVSHSKRIFSKVKALLEHILSTYLLLVNKFFVPVVSIHLCLVLSK